jgi:hypothetical protein
MRDASICFIVNPLVNIVFIHINIFNLLIKIYLFLIFIKYFINESIVNIKLLGQKFPVKKIIKLL